MQTLRHSSPKGAKVGLIFAHPERLDLVDNEHLTTRSGRFLKHVLHECGAKPSECFIDYICPTYPGRKGFASLEMQDLVKAYKPALSKHLKEAEDLRVIILFGQQVPQYFGIQDSLKATRGFVFDQKRIPFIPTFEPRMLFQGGGDQEVTFYNDIDKAVNIAKYGFKRPTEDFVLGPSYNDVKQFISKLLQSKARIYVDIEAVGSLNNRDRNEITMIGVGDGTTERVLVIPFIQQGGVRYWNTSDEERVRSLLRQLFTTTPCVFHNAEYDVKHLNYQGFGPVKIGGDTMLLHHALHPELPHSLDYVTSVYGNIPYWKATLKKAKSQLEIENEKLWLYNARDVLATMQIEPELEAECKEQETYSVYQDISIPLLDVVLEMNKNGLPVDANRLVKWRSDLAKRNEDILDNMSNLWNVHPEFNWDSAQQITWLFYGEEPKGMAKKRAEYASYFEEGSRKKKNTKKFAALQEYLDIFDKTAPFNKLPGLSIKRTSAGYSTDDEMRKRISEAIIKRTDALMNMVRKTEAHEEEQINLAAMRQVMENLTEYAVNGKLLSTYTKLHIEPDGKVHPGFKVAGTKTGRLSSYSPNGQNLPPAAKRIFVAPPGWKFVQFDYTNLELVVLAYFANIPYLIDVFRAGKNVHDENTIRFLGISKKDPRWELWRRVMKMYVFGRNYGGSLRGMYRRLLTAIPGLQMTFKQFCDLDTNYFRLMPEYKEWYDETTDILKRTRTLRNAFGRIRIFLGQIDKVAREGLNFPIQSTAADIMAFGLISLFAEYKKAKRKGLKMQLCLSVHDSVVLLAPESELLVVTKMFKKCLCAPRKIGEYDVSFDGEVRIMDDLKGNDKTDEKKLDTWIEILEERRKAKMKGKMDGRAWLETGNPWQE